MSAEMPEILDAWRMVVARREFEGRVALSALPRLRDALSEAGGEVVFALGFDRDTMQVPYLELRIDAELPLQCQRTLQRFGFPVHTVQRLGLIRDELPRQDAVEQHPAHRGPEPARAARLYLENANLESRIADSALRIQAYSAMLPLPNLSANRRQDAPRFGELMRATSLRYVPTAILSRQTAGIRGSSLIINLPGQPKAIRETLDGVFAAVPYCLDLIGGPYLETHESVVKAFRPKSAQRKK